MDLYLTQLFNDGKNDGDLTIISKDNISIKCHSLVLKTVTAFGSSFENFQKNSDNSKNEIKLDYNGSIIKMAFNMIYSSTYDALSFKPTPYEIIELFTLMDELQLYNSEKILASVIKKFEYGLKEENYIDLLQIVMESDVHKELKKIILEYYANSWWDSYELYFSLKKIPEDIKQFLKKKEEERKKFLKKKEEEIKAMYRMYT